MNSLRSLIHATAGNDGLRHRLRTSPGTRRVVERFVAGEAVAAAATEYLGERTRAERQAEQAVRTYPESLDRLHDEGLSMRADISLDLSAVGPRLDDRLASGNAWRTCAAAEKSGATVTLDVAGSRVRLSRGLLRRDHAVDLNFVRSANTLFALATHDARLISVLGVIAEGLGRKQGSYEFQTSYGVQPDEQRRPAKAGETVRVRVPFGEQWPHRLLASMREWVSRS